MLNELVPFYLHNSTVLSNSTHSEVKSDHRIKFSNLSNWKEEA